MAALAKTHAAPLAVTATGPADLEALAQKAAGLGAVRMRAVQEQFALKDFQTGDFYFRRGGYDSAILYFRGLIATYPSSRLVPEAFVRLVQAYRAIGYLEEREETCAHLREHYGTRPDVREACGSGNPGR